MIYCVEDDSNIRDLVVYTLETTGYKARGFEDGKACMEALASETPELILLDIMLPGEDGMSILGRLKAAPETRDIPVIMVTAKGAEYDKVMGLDSGADDYVTKPFSTITLIARIKALYRRTHLNKLEEVQETDSDDTFDIQTKNFKMNTKTREVFLYGKPVSDLTPKEFDLLKTLASKPRQVFTRSQLLQLVWDYEYYGDERTVDAHIKKLRQKLEDIGPQVIKTVWGVGYKFDDEGND